MTAFAPRENSVGKGMSARQQRGLSIETGLLRGFRQCRERVIAVAARVGDRKGVKLAFGNFNDLAKAGKQVANAFAIGIRQSARKTHGRQSASTAANRAWHGAGPAHG